MFETDFTNFLLKSAAFQSVTLFSSTIYNSVRSFISKSPSKALILYKDKTIFTAEIIQQTVFVFDPFNTLWEAGFYGKGTLSRGRPLSNLQNEKIQIMPEEAFYLAFVGLLSVHQNDCNLSIPDLFQVLSSRTRLFTTDPNPKLTFLIKFSVYCFFKRHGYVIKNGIKFGTDYLLYEYGPSIDHALSAVSIVSIDAKSSLDITWRNVIKSSRVCNKSGKKFRLVVVQVPENVCESLKSMECKQDIIDAINLLKISTFQIERWIPKEDLN